MGNMVHSWISHYINWKIGEGEKPEIPTNEIALKAITKWVNWEKTSGYTWHYSERIIYSQKWHYAGTLDAIAEKNGKLIIVDFKTSKKVYDEHKFQIAAYVKSVEEEFGEKIEDRVIIQLSKETGATKINEITDKVSNLEEDFAAFVGLRAVYRRLKGA